MIRKIIFLVLNNPRRERPPPGNTHTHIQQEMIQIKLQPLTPVQICFSSYFTSSFSFLKIII